MNKLTIVTILAAALLAACQTPPEKPFLNEAGQRPDDRIKAKCEIEGNRTLMHYTQAQFITGMFAAEKTYRLCMLAEGYRQ